MNMFKPVGAQNVDEYFALIEGERKEQMLQLDKLILETVPKLTRHFAYNMIGYGSFQYTNNKKQTLDWPVIALASQKNYISLYICCVVDGKYLAEGFRDRLGKVSVGKSCVRFKKIEDVNVDVLKELLLAAQKNPGMQA